MNLAVGVVLGVSLLVSAWICGEAARTVQPLGPAECRVMEQHLARRGFPARVESGALVQAGGEVVAQLTLVPAGQTTAVPFSYRLGPADNSRVLAGHFPSQAEVDGAGQVREGQNR